MIFYGAQRTFSVLLRSVDCRRLSSFQIRACFFSHFAFHRCNDFDNFLEFEQSGPHDNHSRGRDADQADNDRQPGRGRNDLIQYDRCKRWRNQHGHDISGQTPPVDAHGRLLRLSPVEAHFFSPIFALQAQPLFNKFEPTGFYLHQCSRHNKMAQFKLRSSHQKNFQAEETRCFLSSNRGDYSKRRFISANFHMVFDHLPDKGRCDIAFGIPA